MVWYRLQGKTIKGCKDFKERGFIGINIDPYLYMKKSEKSLVYIALHVDDNLVIGNQGTIEGTIGLLQTMVWFWKLKKIYTTICNVKMFEWKKA